MREVDKALLLSRTIQGGGEIRQAENFSRRTGCERANGTGFAPSFPVINTEQLEGPDEVHCDRNGCCGDASAADRGL